jgi:hypothetical protein
LNFPPLRDNYKTGEIEKTGDDITRMIDITVILRPLTFFCLRIVFFPALVYSKLFLDLGKIVFMLVKFYSEAPFPRAVY